MAPGLGPFSPARFDSALPSGEARKAMIGAGASLGLVGLFGVLDTIETMPKYWQGWPGWIIPIEAAVLTAANLFFAVMLLRGIARVVPSAAAWSLACLVITLQALSGLGFVPLLGANAPALSPLSVFCCDPPPVQVAVAAWFGRLAPGLQVDFVPPAVAYLIAATQLVWLRRSLPAKSAGKRVITGPPQSNSAGGLMLEALGFANIYGAMYFLGAWEGTGDFQQSFFPLALADGVGLVIGIAMVIVGQRVRTGRGSRLLPATGAALAAVILWISLFGLGTEWSFSIAFSIAPGMAPLIWTGEPRIGSAAMIAATGLLFAACAALMLVPMGRTSRMRP